MHGKGRIDESWREDDPIQAGEDEGGEWPVSHWMTPRSWPFDR